MATDSNTLLDEAKCLGCASNSSTSELLKLGILGRISSAYSAVQSFISRAGITDPGQIAAVQTLAQSAVENGWWGKCDLIYPFVGGTALAHSQNLKSSNFTITWNGTVTHNANGITGDGATGYGDTGYIPSNSSRILLNSAHATTYRRTIGTAGRFHYGVSNPLRLGTFSATAVRGSINDNTTSVFTGLPSNFVGLLGLTRISSSRKDVYAGNVQKSASVASVSIGNLSFVILADSIIAWDTVNLAGLTVGSGITFSEYQLMAADWQTFQTALGRQV